MFIKYCNSKLGTAHLKGLFLLPILDLPACSMTDQQLGNLLPLLLAGSVQCCVPVTILSIVHAQTQRFTW